MGCTCVQLARDCDSAQGWTEREARLVSPEFKEKAEEQRRRARAVGWVEPLRNPSAPCCRARKNRLFRPLFRRAPKTKTRRASLRTGSGEAIHVNHCTPFHWTSQTFSKLLLHRWKSPQPRRRSSDTAPARHVTSKSGRRGAA